MKRIVYFVAWSVIFLFGCKNQEQKLSSDIRFKDVAVPVDVNYITSIGNFTNNFKYIIDSSSTYLYSYSWKDKAVFIGDLNAIGTKFDLSFLNNEIEFSQGTDLIFKSRSEAILLCSDERKLVLINLANKKYEILSYDTLIAGNTFPLSYWNSSMLFSEKLYLPIAYSDIFIKNKESIYNYFSRKIGVAVSIQDGISAVELFGNFPLSYQNGDFYNDFYSKLTELPNNGVAYSFSCDDSIYIYNKNQKEARFFGSGSKKGFKPFSLTELRNGNYKRKYTLEEPRYLQLIYDPYTNLVYRVYKHKSDYLVEGKVVKSIDISWSLLVSDLNFSEITEYEFVDGNYSPIGMMPTDAGLFILKYKQENEQEIRGSLFQIPSP
ncbi:MAG: hypothetical protein J7K39_03020 [Bacteroidales bacterium]|nr:hypothetical protein [Bacteroidales bacterium]